MFYPPAMKDKFGIMNMQMLIWFLRPLKDLTGIKHSDKSTDEKASILVKTICNIMSSYAPNEIVTIDDRDSPWICNKIKSLKVKLNISRIVSNPIILSK